MEEQKIIKIEDTKLVEALFQNTTDTVILSCLQKVMGEIYATEDLKSAMAILGDFSFFVGIPCEELLFFGVKLYSRNRGLDSTDSGQNPGNLSMDQQAVKSDKDPMDHLVMVPENEDWEKQIEQSLGTRAEKRIRYAIKKEGLQVFDRDNLQKVVDRLWDDPRYQGYELRMIDRALYGQIQGIDWCREWVENYPTYELFGNYALGAVILKEGEPVAGASSYSGYLQGIEITIRTKEEYQRQGLACICAAKLILECIQRGLYPSWDAANTKSVALSEKLGYHFDKEYIAYRVVVS